MLWENRFITASSSSSSFFNVCVQLSGFSFRGSYPQIRPIVETVNARETTRGLILNLSPPRVDDRDFASGSISRVRSDVRARYL